MHWRPLVSGILVAALLGPGAAQAQDPVQPSAGPDSAAGSESAAEQIGQAEPPVAVPPVRPWRLNDQWHGLDFLKITGEQRSRYETLHKQFRYGREGGKVIRPFGRDEDVLALRTSLMIAGGSKQLSAGVELLYAHQFGNDESSYVDSTMIDTLDVLQAYVDVQLGLLGGGSHRLRLGRETIDVGSRRFTARNFFRNTVNSFGGADWQWESAESKLRAFWTLPTERRPDEFDSNLVNQHGWDRQSLGLQFAGAHWDRRISDATSVELYVFGLLERRSETRRRELLTPGFRYLRSAKPDHWNCEFESALQFGQSKVEASEGAPVLDHFAGFATAAVGYTWDAAWQPNLAVSASYASGDSDPDDNTNQRFDTLFGARRFEYGPTGIWGAISRANMISPELRVALRPTRDWEFVAAWRGLWLAAARDAWTAGGLRDRTGNSGRHVADQIEARLRWQAIPKNLQLEFGAAYLMAASFQERASNGIQRDASYGYLEMTWWF